ncbi:MAG: M50 family metallopeptidase [Melioribacteraceae bacterium]|nr:M50 family metallopeptidase [Melioribacteraceae bacterium]
MKLNKKQKKQIELGIILFALFLSFLLWNSFLIYPIKLFVVLTHEMSHGIFAILSGGKLHSLLLTSSLSGESRTIGGNKFIIASAGYLGSLIFGVLLFISGYKEKLRKVFSTILAILLILFAANYLEGGFGRISAVLFALIFILFPIYLPQIANAYFYKILGIISMAYVAIDIKEDILTNIYRPSDAQFIAEITSISPIVWGVLWMFISLAAIFLLLRWGYSQLQK